MFPLSKTLKGLIEKCYYFYLSVLPTYPGVLRKGKKAEVLFIRGTAHQEYTRYMFRKYIFFFIEDLLLLFMLNI